MYMIESANLKNAAGKGLLWSAIERFGAQGIQFIFGILITRILLPANYGLLVVLPIFMAVGQTLINSGFGLAFKWKKDSRIVNKFTGYLICIFQWMD